MLEVLNHPLIIHKLTQMRNKETGTKDFRENLDEIAELMAYEVCRDLPIRPVDIETPIGPCTGYELAKKVVIVPILRAGIGLLDGIRRLVPTAKVGFIGLYRDEETLEPHEYFAKFPKGLDEAIVMIVDPMLATGGSASAALTKMKNAEPNRSSWSAWLACRKVSRQFRLRIRMLISILRQWMITSTRIGYIVPGLGDAGDRIFGTK